MGIRVRLHDGEPIGPALRRFKKLLSQHRRLKWYKPHSWWFAEPHFVRDTDLRRAKKHNKWVKSRRATEADRREGKQPPPPA